MLDSFLSISPMALRGTHASVERYAYRLFRHACPGHSLPPFPMVRAFSGALGPDVAWALGRFGASRSRYVPRTRAGGGIDEILLHWQRLRGASSAWRRARYAGWLSHLTADLLDPAHQVGRPGRVRSRFLLWSFLDDWDDPLTGPLWRAGERHNHFELLLARTTAPWRGTDLLGVVLENLRWFRRQLTRSPLRRLLHDAAADVARSGLWEEYLEFGDTPRFRARISRGVLPQVPALMTLLWSTALGAAPRPAL